MKVLVNFRVESLTLELYKARASEAGMNLSDWIRMNCEQRAEPVLTPRERLPAPAAPDRDAPVRKARHGMCEHRRREDQYCSACD